MKPGTQIAYIPAHANGDPRHSDVEFGFVMSEGRGIHFCRYWKRGEPGMLRTAANSEATPTEYLVPHYSVPQDQVDGCLSNIIRSLEE